MPQNRLLAQMKSLNGTSLTLGIDTLNVLRATHNTL